MSETRQKSADRFNRRNDLARARKRPQQFINTPGGNLLTGNLVEPLAEFLAGRHPAGPPDSPPRFLSRLVKEADPRFLALAALAPLLDGIFRGLDSKDRSWEAKLKLRVGEDLYRRLAKPKGDYLFRWSVKQRLHAGNWLLKQAMVLDVLDHDADGIPCLSAKGERYAANLWEYLIKADPLYAPFLKPPEPWMGWSKTYDDGFQATFVRDWRPETKRAISDAFLTDWEHAKGVNALARVPLRIDTDMLALVKRFAVDIMGNAGAKRKADELAVVADVKDAEYCGDQTFWLDYSCDRRGRVYALQNLNFAREDHVRSLFRFARGMKLGSDYWLRIQCANAEGSTEKESRDERIAWVGKHHQDIMDIAADPVGTFDKWKDAEAPFCYVAACRELAAAWNDPNFETTLPIGFDGSANGLQHLALLSGDFNTACLVNLVSEELLLTDDTPADVYTTLVKRAVRHIEADTCDDAIWWWEILQSLDDKQRRKLLKRPGMTFSYGVTLSGATDQIEEAYEGLRLRRNTKPTRKAFQYLAKTVLKACKDELYGPKCVMDYIKAIVKHRTRHGGFLEWKTPTGLPVENRYQKLNNIIVECKSGGVRVRHKVADGATDEINKRKVLGSASANFVHSMDAAHLIKVVNAAVGEGISDLLTVHDCFYCLAPQADRFHDIIRNELYRLYRDNDPLAELRSRNVSGDILPVPPKGSPVRLSDGEPAEIPIPLEGVRRAPNAFG